MRNKTIEVIGIWKWAVPTDDLVREATSQKLEVISANENLIVISLKSLFQN